VDSASLLPARSPVRYLPNQPGYHKRLKAAAPLLAAAITHLARVSPSWCDQLRLVDATPVPCAASRETVQRSELSGWSGYGYCAAHSRYYWGLKLYLLAAPDGMPIAWCLADPKLGEREVCLDLLSVAVETSDAAPRTEPADPPRSSTNRRRSGWPRTCRRRRGACAQRARVAAGAP